MAQTQTRDTYEAIADDLAEALEEADDAEARYHIRRAAQRIVIATGDYEN